MSQATKEQKIECCDGFPLRPGGFALTLDLLKASGLKSGSVIVDIGCGYGESVRLLCGQGYEAYGLDVDKERIEAARRQNPTLSDRFFCRDAAELLNAQGEFFLAAFGFLQPDVFLFECSFTKLKNPELTARQAFSALKPGGFVLLSDVVIRAEESSHAETPGTDASELFRKAETPRTGTAASGTDAPDKTYLFPNDSAPPAPSVTTVPAPEASSASPDAGCLLGRLIPSEKICTCFTDAGFTLRSEKEHPHLLPAYLGNLILNYGTEAAEHRLGMKLSQLKTASPVYASMLFKKTNCNPSFQNKRGG